MTEITRYNNGELPPSTEEELTQRIEAMGAGIEPTLYQQALFAAVIKSIEASSGSQTAQAVEDLASRLSVLHEALRDTDEIPLIPPPEEYDIDTAAASPEPVEGLIEKFEGIATDRAVIANGWVGNIDPSLGLGSVVMLRSTPTTDPDRVPIKKEYWAGDLAEGDRMPTRVYDLMNKREFARTGVVPESVNGKFLDATNFYRRYEEREGLRPRTGDASEKPYRDLGGTIVRIDGWTLWSLGVDIATGRGSFSFAVQGDDVPYSEMLARAKATYPVAFEKLHERGKEPDLSNAGQPREVVIE